MSTFRLAFSELSESLDSIRESYPHVYAKLELFYGEIEFAQILSDLINDNRGDRHGFPTDIMETLIKIYNKEVNA